MNSKGLRPFGCKRSWVQLRIHCSFARAFLVINLVKLPPSRLLNEAALRQTLSRAWCQQCG